MNNAIPTDKQTTIKGYKIDIEFEDMGDDYFGTCFVQKGDYCSSLGRLEDEGTLVNSEDDELTVPDAILNKIFDWTEANGY